MSIFIKQKRKIIYGATATAVKVICVKVYSGKVFAAAKMET